MTAIDCGKLPGLILIDGAPLKNMRDPDKITTVIKGASPYEPPPSKKPAASVPKK